MPEATPRLDAVLREVNACCTLLRGRKADLARFLGARPSQLHEWLTHVCQPGAEYVLGMIEWLSAQKAAVADISKQQPGR
jgi:hypothetical protein